MPRSLEKELGELTETLSPEIFERSPKDKGALTKTRPEVDAMDSIDSDGSEGSATPRQRSYSPTSNIMTISGDESPNWLNPMSESYDDEEDAKERSMNHLNLYGADDASDDNDNDDQLAATPRVGIGESSSNQLSWMESLINEDRMPLYFYTFICTQV
jgi:hypothetical protein